MDVTSFLQMLGGFVEALFGWAETAITFIAEQPLILVPMLTFFIGGGVVGIINRLMRG